jgi:mycothiol maleylpyruvate isomerase-like protein
VTEGRAPNVVGGGPATIGASSIVLDGSRGPVGSEQLVALADRLGDVMSAGSAVDWHRTAGDLDWTVRRTAGHLVDALAWNAVQLASGLERQVRIDSLPPTGASPGEVIEAVRAAARLLRAAVDTSRPDGRSWHRFGTTDPGGALAAGLAELLVHGEDITRGLRLAWNPDVTIVVAVQERLIPQAVGDYDPWTVFLAAHGRSVGDASLVASTWTWDMTPPGDG